LTTRAATKVAALLLSIENPKETRKMHSAGGLIVEVHPNPQNALSDGMQSLDFPAFTKIWRNGILFGPHRAHALYQGTTLSRAVHD
jgi:hypothetical protein